MSTEIILSDKAFIGMILSSVEVYKNECYGTLLGYRTHKRIIVEYAIPFQSVKRTPNEVIPNWRRELKVLKILPRIIQLKKLGYFHSHTQWRGSMGIAKPSPEDENSIDSREIEIIIAINDTREHFDWVERRKTLWGSLGDYEITIAGYYRRKSDGQLRKYRIVCPYATGLKQAFQDRS